MRRFRSALVTVVGLGLVAGIASYVPPTEAKATGAPAPATQPDKSISGRDLQVPDRRQEPAKAASETPAPVWPASSDNAVSLAVAGTTKSPSSVVPLRAGDSPVSIGLVPSVPTAKAAPSPTAVRVEVFDQAKGQSLGVQGLALRLTRADGQKSPSRVRLSIDYSSFRTAYGADWASRLRLVQLQCSSATACDHSSKVLGGNNDGQAKTYSADVTVSGSQSAFALAAAPSGPNGSYAATSLSPASTWNTGNQTGDFNWSYPFRMPPGTTGPRPELSIGYSSGSVDGQTASANSQTSWLGQGQSLEPGYVERKYVSCADDMGTDAPGANNKTKTGDLCWKSNNATLSLGSHSSELLWDESQQKWKLRKDDGSRIEHLTGAPNNDVGDDAIDGKGEYWRLTTADGTQYYFGLNPVANATSARTNSVSLTPVFGNHSGEPCYAGDTKFATSYCQQAWRWNVDRVVDRSGNIMTYRYVKETNNYGRNNNTGVSSYDRASYLSSIEYGVRSGDQVTPAPARVIFGVTERCEPNATVTCAPEQLTAANASRWPDVPFDQICTSTTTCPNATSPAFFTRKRLYTLYTQLVTKSGTTVTPRTVDSWSFTPEYVDPGDGTSKVLWLKAIQHKGLVGGEVTDPPVTLQWVSMTNRVDGYSGGAFPMKKPRLSKILTESGAQIGVTYSAPECSTLSKPADVANNSMRCFPVYWSAEGASGPTLHMFHKYLVTKVIESDLLTNAPFKETTLTYPNEPAWHYDDNELTLPKYRTWGDWRGYAYVYVQTGPVGFQTSKRYLYFRGMHGDRASTTGSGTKTVMVKDTTGAVYADFDRLNGFVREEITYNGAGGAEVTGTVNTPWLKQTATGGGYASTLLNTLATRTRTRLSDGSYRISEIDTTYDEDYGLPTAVSDLGDVARGDDDRCTRFTYNRNEDEGVGIVDTVSREEKVSVSCSAAPNRPSQVISDERTYYDQNPGLADKPTKGLVSKLETMTGWTSGAVYSQRARMVYDALGRTVETYDGLTANGQDRLTSSVAFVPATGGPVTQTITTNAAGHVTKSTLEPAWGSPVLEEDANGKKTELAYDATGRMTGVWLADRPRSGTASVAFSYQLSNTAGQPNVVTTQELKPNGTYKTSTSLFDGLLRQRQTQTQAANGVGRLIKDTRYGDRGQVADESGLYYESTTGPTGKVFSASDNNLPSQTIYTVDGVDRVTLAVFKVDGAEKWRTTTSYGGDNVAVDPPNGTTATATYTDIRGNTTELRQFQGGSPTGAYDSTAYTYTSDDQLATVKNAANSVWRYTYDLRGRQISAQDPDKGTTTSTYDDADRLVSTKDAGNQSLFYDYDVLDRKTALHSGSATGTVLASWKYDTLAKGQVTSSTRTIDGNNYESAITGYDALSRPTGTKITIPASEGKLAGVYTSSTEYTANGEVKKVQLPAVPGLSQETVESLYSPSGYLQSVAGDKAYVVGAQYSSYGDPLRYEMGDGLQNKASYQSFTYEVGTRRLQSMSVNRQTQSAADDVLNYTYDAAGNVTSLAHSQVQGAGMDRQCFDYDYLRRMTQARTTANASCATAPTTGTMGASSPYWRSYEYSKSGNRTKQIDYGAAGNTTTSYAYPAETSPRPHAVTGVTSAGPSVNSADSYSYDATGNLATRIEGGDTENFAWDAEGNLKSVTDPNSAAVTDFVYDAEGDRLVKHDPTGATLYLGQTEVRWDKAADALSSTRYYQFNGATVAMRTSPTQITSLMADPQGTATVSIDVSTDQLVRRWMDPFGVQRGKDTAWKPGIHGFVDGQQDDSTGLTHLGAREYDPKLGKFISVDPLVDIADPQTLNGYSYSNSNPATFSDPDGQMYLGSKAAPGDDGQADHSAMVSQGTLKGTPNYRAKHPRTAQDDIRDAISQHEEKKRIIKERLKTIVKDLVKIVADELGITDALNCFTNGDISSCIATGVTVLSSFAGGVAGKLLSKYGAPWKWKKAAALVGKLKDLAGDAVSAIKDLVKIGKSCPLGNSFVPGTKVLMADGSWRPIEQLILGDKVKATDPATGQTSPEPVVATIKGHGLKHLVDLTVTTKKAGTSHSAHVVATDGHPFYDPASQRWIRATDLQPGESLQPLATAAASHVTATKRYDATATVYNLSVANHHTYNVQVGSTAVLVHNCGGPVKLSDEVIDTHILPLHGPGTPAVGSKFADNIDPDDFEAIANEAVSGSPVPSRRDPDTGNHAHDFDLGRVVGSRGETQVRVWVDPARNVRSMYPRG
jgi:RHS repeat-associated protein